MKLTLSEYALIKAKDFYKRLVVKRGMVKIITGVDSEINQDIIKYGLDIGDLDALRIIFSEFGNLFSNKENLVLIILDDKNTQNLSDKYRLKQGEFVFMVDQYYKKNLITEKPQLIDDYTLNIHCNKQLLCYRLDENSNIHMYLNLVDSGKNTTNWIEIVLNLYEKEETSDKLCEKILSVVDLNEFIYLYDNDEIELDFIKDGICIKLKNENEEITRCRFTDVCKEYINKFEQGKLNN